MTMNYYHSLLYLPCTETTLLIFCFFSFLILTATPSFCSTNNTNTLSLTTCLANNGVNNFTLFPNNRQDTTAYYTFLNFSIQNLRFAQPSLPKPLAIVMPETKHQLVNAMLCCRKGSWEIRVRCGGHSYEGTSSVATDGSPFLIIDLINLDNVSVDLDSRAAWVEGGATLGKTYYAISEASRVLGFSAGSCPTVGIGGHISGGGFGLLSRKYGLAADNVVDALLVDAEGRVLNRESMGEEVFWAIRGGGGGMWGIVYAWKIRLLKVPETVTGFVVSRPGTKRYVAGLVDKWQHVSPKLSDDLYLSCFLGAGLPERAPVIGISATFKGFYLGPKAEMVTALNRVFPELNITTGECREMSWIESVVYFSGLGNVSTWELKERYLAEKLYFKAKSDYVRTPIPRSGIRSALEILEKEAKGYVIMDPYGGFMERADSQSIPFPHRQGNLFTIQYMVEWKSQKEEEDDHKYIEWIRGFYESMRPYVSSGPRAAYINYMDLDLGVMMNSNTEVQLRMPNSNCAVVDDDWAGAAAAKARVWGEKYFLGNYERLVRAKTLVDPHNVFRNQQGIPPMSLPPPTQQSY